MEVRARPVACGTVRGRLILPQPPGVEPAICLADDLGFESCRFRWEVTAGLGPDVRGEEDTQGIWKAGLTGLGRRRHQNWEQGRRQRWHQVGLADYRRLMMCATGAALFPGGLWLPPCVCLEPPPISQQPCGVPQSSQTSMPPARRHHRSQGGCHSS